MDALLLMCFRMVASLMPTLRLCDLILYSTSFTHTHTRTVSKSLSLSLVRELHRCVRGLEHICLACAVLLARSRFREILSNLRASGSCYQYAGDSRNFRETWDVCLSKSRRTTCTILR